MSNFSLSANLTRTLTKETNGAMGHSGTAWHAQAPGEVLHELGTSDTGLSSEQVKTRLEIHGPNQLKPVKQRGPVLRFLAQFQNILIYVLLGSAIVTALLGHWVDTGVILAVVFVNAIVGFVQEGRAETALDAIRDMLSPNATVVRDGRHSTVPAETLVPGDIVDLESGDRVPADLRLLTTRSLQVQEAALTGESVPVEKSPRAVQEGTALAERASMAFSGTFVTYGRGRGVVVTTGGQTQIGRISSLLAEVSTLTTPLLRQMATFARWLTLGILALSAATFLFGFFLRGYTAPEMFLAAVGLAVAAIPEGLPAIMTVTLAIGVTRMARRNAIIRLLPAVETLGSVSVICSDKTGTLTRNEMAVQSVVTAQRAYEVKGSGYTPMGSVVLHGEAITLDDHPDLRAVVQAAMRCNDSDLTETESGWELHGNPTDGALLALGLKAGCDLRFERQTCPRTDLIPFESDHKFMATLHHDHEGQGYVYVKGAPERILAMCAFQRSNGDDEPIDADYWRTRTEELARGGARVLAIACRPTDTDHRSLTFEDVGGGLTLIGLFGLIDPPREEAIAAIARCKAAGVNVKMITGDHALTARAIGERLGIGNEHGVITGPELDRLDDEAFAAVAGKVAVFARTTPEHKLRLVEALQAQGQIVVMTGDGVNDAPALKRANVGVAMGKKSTEVAKEAAEMVLADDNFVSIAHAVEEGRTVYDNLKKAILFILPTNGGEALIIMLAIFLGQVLPITPVQILWVNMVTAVTLALALAFEGAETDIMKRRPRAPNEPILSGFLVWRIVFVSLLLVAGAFGLFFLKLEETTLETARTVAVNTLVAGEIVYLINSRRIHAPAWTWDGVFGSRPVVLAIAVVCAFQLLFTYLPVLQRLFGTAPIDVVTWAGILAFALFLFVAVEMEKALWRILARWLGKHWGGPAGRNGAVTPLVQSG